MTNKFCLDEGYGYLPLESAAALSSPWHQDERVDVAGNRVSWNYVGCVRFVHASLTRPFTARAGDIPRVVVVGGPA